ncbi:MAG: N-acetylmuramic acid 6-phosphate etherase [Streptosporangiaceae bacterium]
MTFDGGTAERVNSPTERRNPRTLDIDMLPTIEVLRLINAEDAVVPTAVADALPDLAKAVDVAVAALAAGHRVHYFGAGTSGRLGTMDAAELPPTYAIEPGRVVAHHAGGPEALDRALEDVEDDEDEGARAAAGVASGDVVVGLTASGRTPYVAGALRAARAAGAGTALVSANPHAPLASLADVHVGVDTGPEAVAGSTRMKAGTAQKIVLGAFSTAVMVRLGRTYSNLMVSVLGRNSKLRGRAVTILEEATGESAARCEAALTAAQGDTRVALVSLLTGAPTADAAAAVAESGGAVRRAIESVGDGRTPAPRGGKETP